MASKADGIVAAETAPEQGASTGPLGGFESWTHLARFVLMLTAICALIITMALIFRAFGILFTSQYFSIGIAGGDTNRAGIEKITFDGPGLRIRLEDGTILANALVPANQPWIQTDIWVEPGATVRLIASGSVNLSQPNTLVLNELPRRYGNFPNYLVTPSGGNIGRAQGSYRSTDDWRNPIKLAPGARLGTLVATITPSREPPALPRRPDVLFTLEEAAQGYRYSGREGGWLSLSVNDLIVDPSPEAEAVYLLLRGENGEPISPVEQRERFRRSYSAASDAEIDEWMAWATRRWREARDRRYYQYFFEDNSGYLLASVSVTQAAKE
jgi:hypothetical protein